MTRISKRRRQGRLGAIGSNAKGAVDALTHTLTIRLDNNINDDESRRLCDAIAEALGAIGPGAKPAVPVLIRLLQEYRPPLGLHYDTIRDYRDGDVSAARALARIGPDAVAAIPSLIEALDRSWPSVDLEAGRALAAIGRPRSRP